MAARCVGRLGCGRPVHALDSGMAVRAVASVHGAAHPFGRRAGRDSSRCVDGWATCWARRVADRASGILLSPKPGSCWVGAIVEPGEVPYLHVNVARDDVELACSILWELGALGIEERDATTLNEAESRVAVTLAAPFRDEASARAALKQVSDRFTVNLKHVAREDWSLTWRRGLKCERVGRRLVLCPSWDKAKTEPSEVVVTIDPENAFGSGTHETTRLALRELDRRVHGGENLLDFGCGSGVLSIAALKLGAARARGIDIDPDAIAVARRNADKNAVGDRLALSTESVTSLRQPYSFIVANIYASVLIESAATLARLLTPGGTLVLSGVLFSEWPDVVRAFSGLRHLLTCREGEWVGLVLRKEPQS